MKVKNLLSAELPKITLTFESGNTTYRFSGVYAGHKSLPSKLLKLMAENPEKGGDKQNEV